MILETVIGFARDAVVGTPWLGRAAPRGRSSARRDHSGGGGGPSGQITVTGTAQFHGTLPG